MIIFRADGNPDVGTGHIMRCLSIADAFRSMGKEAVFAAADGSMKGLIEARGFRCFVLGTDYRDMPSDLEKTCALAEETGARLIVADSYFVTADYLRGLRQRAKLAYIDDRAAFAYPADVLINYNIFAASETYKRLYSESGEDLPRLLLGTGYAPLRAEFRSLPKKEIKEKCTDILISTGGADPVHLGLKMAELISAGCRGSNMRYHLLVGAMNTDADRIVRIASGCENIEVHHGVRDMKSLICSCDIAVSAAGSTLYEICACGVPLITYILADNQIPGAAGFEKQGIAVSCGDARSENICRSILRETERLADSFSERKQRSETMQRLTDGMGALRIAEAL